MELSSPAGPLASAHARRWLLRTAVVIGIVGLVAAVMASGVLDRFTDQDELQASIDRAGMWGPLLFVGLMVVLVALRSVTFLLQPVDWLCGLTRMPMRIELSATFVGLVPPTLVIALTGGGVLDLVL